MVEEPLPIPDRLRYLGTSLADQMRRKERELEYKALCLDAATSVF